MLDHLKNTSTLPVIAASLFLRALRLPVIFRLCLIVVRTSIISCFCLTWAIERQETFKPVYCNYTLFDLAVCGILLEPIHIHVLPLKPRLRFLGIDFFFGKQDNRLHMHHSLGKQDNSLDMCRVRELIKRLHLLQLISSIHKNP